MAFKLPDLPYEAAALEPYLSAETIEVHHGKHHRAYADNVDWDFAAANLADSP
ncbi:MAG: hypothetical protein JW990_19450 [Thermoleophilia bacterium]|nr:hypothetical protein [Thermoleophilia bacterium]